jgi:hypothetical protein
MSQEAEAHLMEGCRWIPAPAEGEDRAVEKWDLSTLVGFDTRRVFWLTNISQDQWRGRHAHRESILATFAITGSCRINLDNGETRQVVELRNSGPGLVVGPWIWHDLVDFSPGCVILVAASTLYSELEYIRDYDTFVRESLVRRQRSNPTKEST